MNTTVKNVLCSLLFLAILAGLLSGVSLIFRPKNNTKEAGIFDSTANGILSEPENSIDVLVLGDSETYNAFIPLKMWKDYGFTTYICGTSSQRIYYTYEFLQKAFKTQSPKVVVLETDTVFRQFGYAHVIANKAEECFSVLRYHDRWKTLSLNDLTMDASYDSIMESRGYVYNNGVAPADDSEYMKPTNEKEMVPTKCRSYVKKIQKFCEDRGAKLVLVSTPSTLNWNYKRHNAMVGFAAAWGLDYIDMNVLRDEIPIDWQTETADRGDHVNYSGALKVTAYLGKYINDLGIFEDKRQLEEYDSWNTAVSNFESSTGETL